MTLIRQFDALLIVAALCPIAMLGCGPPTCSGNKTGHVWVTSKGGKIWCEKCKDFRSCEKHGHDWETNPGGQTNCKYCEKLHKCDEDGHEFEETPTGEKCKYCNKPKE